MDVKLLFEGHIADGVHKFTEQLVVPGANALPVPIIGWPETLWRGTLNFQIAPGGVPDEYLARFSSGSVKHLDTRRFIALAELPARAIVGNTLLPTSAEPNTGIAQIWRASITALHSGLQAQCWVLRRIGSGYENVLECVADRPLRPELRAPEEKLTSARLALEGTWLDAGEGWPGELL